MLCYFAGQRSWPTAAGTFMEKRHARECPRDEMFGLSLDTWAQGWLALWWTTGLLGALIRVEWECSGVMISTAVISCLWVLVATGVVPGCTRLVVNCAATVSFMLLVRDFVCDDSCGRTSDRESNNDVRYGDYPPPHTHFFSGYEPIPIHHSPITSSSLRTDDTGHSPPCDLVSL
jgi:hypothetical protein